MDVHMVKLYAALPGGKTITIGKVFFHEDTKTFAVQIDRVPTYWEGKARSYVPPKWERARRYKWIEQKLKK